MLPVGPRHWSRPDRHCVIFQEEVECKHNPPSLKHCTPRCDFIPLAATTERPGLIHPSLPTFDVTYPSHTIAGSLPQGERSAATPKPPAGLSTPCLGMRTQPGLRCMQVALLPLGATSELSALGPTGHPESLSSVHAKVCLGHLRACSCSPVSLSATSIRSISHGLHSVKRHPGP